MTHLACADEPSNPLNRAQRDAYAAAVTRYPGVTRSFANSGGCFLGPDFAFDVVRPGICLYGGGLMCRRSSAGSTASPRWPR